MVSWTTATDLGRIFENNNFIFPLEADDGGNGPLSFKLVIKNNFALSATVTGLAGKTLIINETSTVTFTDTGGGNTTRNQVITDINAVIPNLAKLESNFLVLIGDSIDIDFNFSTSLILLGLDKTSNIANYGPSWATPLTKFVSIDNDQGVLENGVLKNQSLTPNIPENYRLSPAIPITSPYKITVRAIDTLNAFVDRTFDLVIEPLSAENQISWTPGLLGTGDEGDISEFKIEVENFNKLEGIVEFDLVSSTAGFSDTLSLNNEGLIIGTLPFHTPSPNIKQYDLQVRLFYQGTQILPTSGSSLFSIRVNDVFTSNAIESSIPILLKNSDRSEQNSIYAAMIEDSKIYRGSDPNFGIITKPKIFLLDNITDDTLLNFYNALENRLKRFEIIIGKMQLKSTEKYDVFYYPIFDYNSIVKDIDNPHNINPNPITPQSISILRSLLIDNIGLETDDKLPIWMGDNYFAAIPIMYSMPGAGSDILDDYRLKFEPIDKMPGKRYVIDRIYLRKKNPLIVWPGPQFLDDVAQLKFASDM